MPTTIITVANTDLIIITPLYKSFGFNDVSDSFIVDYLKAAVSKLEHLRKSYVNDVDSKGIVIAQIYYWRAKYGSSKEIGEKLVNMVNGFHNRSETKDEVSEIEKEEMNVLKYIIEGN